MSGYQTTFYKLVDKIINKLRINGFRQVTYGTSDELDMERQNDYPLAHIVFPSGTNNEKTTTISFVLIVADKCDNTGNEYLEYGKDNTIDILQDLLIRAQTTIKMLDRRYSTTYDSIEVGYDLNYDMSFTTFKEDLPNLLTGLIFNVDISFPNMYADLLCLDDEGITGIPGRPYNFGTSGTSGTSGIDGSGGYTIPIYVNLYSPVISTTYHFSNYIATPSTNIELRQFTIAKPGTISAVHIDINATSTIGTDEPVDMYLVVNDTEYLIQSVAAATRIRTFNNSSFSIPVIIGDLVCIKYTSPEWVTRPISCVTSGYILIN